MEMVISVLVAVDRPSCSSGRDICSRSVVVGSHSDRGSGSGIVVPL